MFKNPYFRITLFSLLLVGAISLAGGIKIWANGDTLSATDLNANFSHIHNSMVGGHGARLVNADVSATANIATSKIQNGLGIGRVWVNMGSSCTTATCSIGESQNVTSVTRAGTGIYGVNFSYTGTDSQYAAILSTGSITCFCRPGTKVQAGMEVNCYDIADIVAPLTPIDCYFELVTFDAD